METDAALVRADGVVELHAIAEVVLYLAFVVDPGNAESDDAVRLDHALDDAVLLELGMLVVNVSYREQDLFDGLQILFFARVLCLEGVHDIVNIHTL